MKRRNILIAAVVFTVGGVAWFIQRPRRAEENVDQRVAKTIISEIESANSMSPTLAPPTLASPTLMEQPSDPTLVGKQVCKECHAENFHLHAEHGHGSTFAWVRDSEVSEKFAGKTFDAGPSYGTYHYHRDEQQGLFAQLPGKFNDEPFPLQIALGSGHHAMTLLTLAPDAENQTMGIEHRVSWFAAQDKLGITPGHSAKAPHDGFEFFGDIARDQALDRCIYCHTTTAKVESLGIKDLIPNINCEKCHGAGSEHVRAARMSETPPPYSVGRDDWDTESEIQLCGDCHRLPRSITEKEIREYPDLLVRFQPLGLLRSKCYLEAEGELKCTTCHEPHTSLQSESNANSIASCVKCHGEDADTHVVCPVSPTDGCIECHMPALEREDGLLFHDHWIRVRD